MPRTIKADGRTITVPDDATPEEINQIVGPAPSGTVTPTSGAVLRPLTQRERFLDPNLYPVGVKGEGVGENLHNIAQKAGVGVFQFADALTHPRQTVAGMLASVLPEPVVKGANKFTDLENKIPGAHYLTTKLPEGTENPLKSAYEAVRPGGITAVGNVAPTAGQILAGGALGEAAPAIASDVRSIPKASGRVGEMLTKTGPRETAKLVKETQAENAEAVTKAAEKTEKERAKVAQQNAEQEQGRKLDLRKHFEKTQATKAANEAAEAPVARKEALNRGVEELDPRVHDELVQTEKTVNEQANEKYTALRKVLKNEESGMYQPKDEEGHIQGEPVSVPQRLFDAADESMRGSDTAPTIVKDLGKRVQQGETSLSYNDLQGYREEIGRELRKGTLPPDVYNAYKKMMPMIDDAMQEIADRHGLGKAQTDARSFYREYAQTFLDRDSPVRAAIDTGKSIGRKPGSVVNALQGRNAALEALARYNPELARKLNTIRGYQAEARGISAKPKPGKLLPKLEPKPAPIPEPAPVKPEVKTIGPEEIRGAKTQGLEQRANIIRRRGEWIATGAAGYRALSNILHGNLAAVPPDLLEGGIAVAGVEGIARLLENPKVVEFLTRPTARDLAQVPPELRGDMSTIAQVAARKGIKVDPRIYAIAGAAAPKKTPGDLLRQSQ
jgi:hypothetical protein